MQQIIDQIRRHQAISEEVFANLQSYIYTAKVVVQEALKNNNHLYVFGNGLHAHNANTMVYQLNVKNPFFAFSLTNDVGIITEIANENGFDKIFEKQLEIKAKKGDILLGLSTSGCSKNVLRALSLGRNMGCKTIGISTIANSVMGEFCDVNIMVPTDTVQNFQEMYNMIYNIIIQ
ncbi:MAG: SIS domain-containing protein [Sulfurospirillaceae bacterium]|nr:SIS domain-containing protein [Sulfurospirillaceae bacterium]MDD2826305.1 SIS domain-containing protein [Sulfurospirillaceae bacterium]